MASISPAPDAGDSPAPAAAAAGPPARRLPRAAVDSLADPDLAFVLLEIPFSHYVERARMALRICGVPFVQLGALPLAHIPIVLKHIKATPPEARSGPAARASPAAVPTLVAFRARPDGAQPAVPRDTPLFLLQDSELITRYALLRAAAVGSPAPPLLGPGLQADPDGTIAGADPAIEAAEWRLGKAGAQTRAVAYAHLLPQRELMVKLMRQYATPLQSAAAPLLYYITRVALKRVYNITPATTAAAEAKAKGELAWAGELLAANGGRFLVGDGLSAADLTLAALFAPLLGTSRDDGYGADVPRSAGPGLDALAAELRATPAGAHALAILRAHGSGVAKAGGAKL